MLSILPALVLYVLGCVVAFAIFSIVPINPPNPGRLIERLVMSVLWPVIVLAIIVTAVLAHRNRPDTYESEDL